MEKLRFVNKEELTIEGGMTVNSFTVLQTGSDLTALETLLTEKNMARIEVINEGGLTCAVLENHKLVDETARYHVAKIKGTENYRITVNMEQVNPLTKKLATLETQINDTQLAVFDMAGTVSALATEANLTNAEIAVETEVK